MTDSGENEAVVVGSASSVFRPIKPKRLTYSDLGIIIAKAKRADMAGMTQRVASFERKWNKDYTQTPQMIADAGLYYAGYADCTRCFFCGGGLKNWEAPDDPWIEHARHFPKCTYIRVRKGHRFVELVQMKNKAGEQLSLEDIETAMRALDIDDSREINTTNTNTTTSTTTTTTTSDETPLNIDQLEVENEELKTRLICKICMDKHSCVVFLPCGHLAVCFECAVVLTHCPICRGRIRGSVIAQIVN
ncbi:baculoviral IAP repeat-containing protein 7-B-like [Littorina saxatilis]|uniref:baculoviral IAP repeat-containing protein 7-B-like n=1 Tax=Littorina saxatilis TaxID=31220 RepID=UPI0038B5EE1F